MTCPSRAQAKPPRSGGAGRRAVLAAAGLAAAVLAGGACGDLGPAPGVGPSTDAASAATGSLTQPIVGGQNDPSDSAVVEFTTNYGLCTGTLIAPRVVMTAAHCVADSIEAGTTDRGQVSFGDGKNGFVATIPVIDMAMHRQYVPPAFTQWDIAAVRLADDAPVGVIPIPPNLTALDDSNIGMPVRVVGFGVTDGANQTGAGVKRVVNLTLDGVDYFHITVGDASHNSCQGDSGGPTLADLGQGEVVIGVTSFGSNQCMDPSSMTRVDSLQSWLLQVVDAWSGPCALDGNCVTDGCRTPDPDCDPCGFNGTCGDQCATVDLDCPLGARAGDPCGDQYDCETRLCIPAFDDDRVSYCSVACDPARPLETCPSPLSVCQKGEGGTPVCAYNGPTPSTQGAPCQTGDDCRSGLCDPDDQICVEPCGDGQPACGDPYTCQDLGGGQMACAMSHGGGGGCAVVTTGPGASSGNGPGWLGLALLGLAVAGLNRVRSRAVPTPRRG